MPRLDVRFATNLAATVVQLHNSENLEEVGRFKEMSLSGGLLAGLSIAPKTKFYISVNLPLQGLIKFVGELVKNHNGDAIVKFYFPNKVAMASLWKYLQDLPVKHDVCPYCGQSVNCKIDSCLICGKNMTISDGDYYGKHLLETFIERVRMRLEDLDSSFIQRFIALMDADILNLSHETCEEEFVGTSPSLLTVFSMIRRAAATDMNILVLGESGTGKELTAQAIHEKSLRKDKPFIAVNCAAIPEGLMEAELFGYEKGAFTGAYATKKGRFELAEGGSIFLDEIGDLSPGLQAKLLRFLEDRKIERVGGKSGKKVDIRIIAATNCDLEAMVENKSFRNDLFFRLNSFTIKLPPLRERGDDKVILAKYFFNKFCKIDQASLIGFSDAALEAIHNYNWPGNVRELVNKVRRGLVMATGSYIEPIDMEINNETRPVEVVQIVKIPFEVQRQKIYDVLERNNFVVAHAAKELQVSRPTMYSLIKKLEIAVPGKNSYSAI